jgi:flagellum-specific peptidoglycan hydrolase FlgJ
MEAFEARMDLLVRLAYQYKAYNDALHATTPEDFLTAVSRAWSTDPLRAQKCIAILHAHSDTLTTQPPVETT